MKHLLVAGMLAAITATATAADPDVSKLAKDLSSNDVSVRVAAAEKLAELDADDLRPAREALVGAMRDEYFDVRKPAARAVAKLGPSAVGGLVDVLREGESWSQQSAAEALGLMGPAAGEAASALADALKEAEAPEQTMWLAWALGRMSAEAKSAVPVIAETLEEEKSYAARYLAQALGRIGATSPEAIDALMAAMKRGASGATEALGEAGPAAGKALLAEWKANRHNKRYCYGLIEAIGQVGPDANAAVPELIEEVKGRTDQWFVALAARSLGKIGPGAYKAVPALVKVAADHGYADARRSAAWALGEIDVTNAGVTDALDKAAASKNESVAAAAREALEKLKASARTKDDD